jgi:hypothetical protein
MYFSLRDPLILAITHHMKAFQPAHQGLSEECSSVRRAVAMAMRTT